MSPQQEEETIEYRCRCNKTFRFTVEAMGKPHNYPYQCANCGLYIWFEAVVEQNPNKFPSTSNTKI